MQTSHLKVRQGTVTAISQAELATFLEARQQTWRCEALRQELLGLLEAGTWVEPGPLSVRVECVPRPLLSIKALTPALGEARVRELLAAVEPTVFRNLIIHETPTKKR